MGQVVMVSLSDLQGLLGDNRNTPLMQRKNPPTHLFRFGDGQAKYLALLNECVPIVAKITDEGFETIKEIPLFGGTSSVKIIDCGIGTKLF